jgi:hypothetical protein
MSGYPFRGFARGLLARGFSPIPILPGQKRPALPVWQRACELPLSPDTIGRLEKSTVNYGVGIALGFNGLVAIDVDTDAPEIIAAVRGVVPASSLAKAGRRGRTDFYRAQSGTVRSRRIAGETGMLVEVLSHGCQTVIPPTQHPNTGTPYRWIGDVTITDIQVSDLPELAHDVADRLTSALAPWSKQRASPAAPATRPRHSTLGEIERVRQIGYVNSILRSELPRLAAMAPNSGRNRAAYVLVCRVGRWCHAGLLTNCQVVTAIVAASEANGLISEDGLQSVYATIASGFSASMHDPLPNLGFTARGGTS